MRELSRAGTEEAAWKRQGPGKWGAGGGVGVSEGRDTVAKRFHSPGISSRQDRLPYFLPQGCSRLRSKARPSERRRGQDYCPGSRAAAALFHASPNGRVHASVANADGGQCGERTGFPFFTVILVAQTKARRGLIRVPFWLIHSMLVHIVQIVPFGEIWKLCKVK